jgi:flagellar FliL protein
MKLIIIIVVLLVVVLGGGGAWFFFLKDDGAPKEDAVVLPPDPIFLKLDTLSLHIIRGGGVKKYIILNLTLEMRDKASRALAEQKMPKLRDVFIASMNEYFSNLPSLKSNVNMKTIKRRLLNISAKAIGEGRVVGVLVQSVFERASTP